MDDWRNILKAGAFVVTVTVLIVAGYFIARNEFAAAPCSPEGFPGRCYHVPQSVCEIAWNNAEASCKDYVKGFNFGPGRLIGPMVSRCQHATFDKAFPYSRRSNEDCDSLHYEMEEWRKRNMN